MSKHDSTDYICHVFERSGGEDSEVKDQNGDFGWSDCEREVENLVGIQALNHVRHVGINNQTRELYLLQDHQLFRRLFDIFHVMSDSCELNHFAKGNPTVSA